MLHCEQFRKLIIEPVLSKLQVYSKSAEELLVFTCAAESDGGHYLHQINGSALGIFQMEHRTYTDIWANFIRHDNRLSMLLGLHFACARIPDPDRMIYDLHYSTALARIHYLRVREPLPKVEDVEGMWLYYKKYYNTPKGKAKRESAIADYERFIK